MSRSASEPNIYLASPPVVKPGSPTHHLALPNTHVVPPLPLRAVNTSVESIGDVVGEWDSTASPPNILPRSPSCMFLCSLFQVFDLTACYLTTHTKESLHAYVTTACTLAPFPLAVVHESTLTPPPPLPPLSPPPPRRSPSPLHSSPIHPHPLPQTTIITSHLLQIPHNQK